MNQKTFVTLLCATTLCFGSLQTSAKEPARKVIRKDFTAYSLIQPDEMVKTCKSEDLKKPIKEAFKLDLLIPNCGRNGIDISHYQGTVDWELVAQEEIGYVYLKATEGASLVDNTYERNLSEAKRVGLKVGSYHFYSSRIPIEDQYNNLKAHILPEEQDLIPIIDVETRGTVSHDVFVRDLKRFLSMVEDVYGKKPIVYTYQNFYNKYLVGEIPEYKLMIACYKYDMPRLNDDKDFVMWQFTSSGRINGIRGNVDRSRILDDYSFSEILL